METVISGLAATCGHDAAVEYLRKYVSRRIGRGLPPAAPSSALPNLLHTDVELTAQQRAQRRAIRVPPHESRFHLNEPIAKALMAQAPNLFTSAPVIESLEVVGAKVPE